MISYGIGLIFHITLTDTKPDLKVEVKKRLVQAFTQEVRLLTMKSR